MKLKYLILVTLLFSCKETDISKIPDFNYNPNKIDISDKSMVEISGICESKNIKGFLWVHEDGPNISHINLINNSNGVLQGKIELPIIFRDMEDITIGFGPKKNSNYLYLADVGDNKFVYNEYYIYRFEEPLSIDKTLINKDIDIIRFKFPDGSHDTECVLIDPSTNDIYLVTKGTKNSGLYKLAYPQNVNNIQEAVFVQHIQMPFITSGGISSDGNFIVLMNYFSLVIWQKKTNETIPQTFLKQYKALPNIIIDQAEAFCFANDVKSYYTSGESLNPQLFHYTIK
jgi:hypothetical protein